VLYASLVCSGIILAASVLAARYAKNPVGPTIGWAVGVAVLPILWMMAFPAVWLQAAILAGGLILAALAGRGRPAVVPLSVLAVLVAYGVVGTSVVREQEKVEELRARYPLESLEARLPRPVPPSEGGDPRRLLRLEEAVEKQAATGRMYELRALHDAEVHRFVNSPGFGVMRLSRGVPSGRELAGEGRADAPEQGDYFRLAPKGDEKLPDRPDESALGRLHEAGFLDFVNPRGFGYVKSRREVAGFRPHGFSKTPDPAGEWAVASLELVGLLRHDEPVVYLSQKLPRMDELKDARTRPLDAFETAALRALRAGADLHVEDDPGVRFVGAIRSTKQCAGCHDSQRGDLLGAFTYRLAPAGR
jgi:hypothetical protein